MAPAASSTSLTSAGLPAPAVSRIKQSSGLKRSPQHKTLCLPDVSVSAPIPDSEADSQGREQRTQSRSRTRTRESDALEDPYAAAAVDVDGDVATLLLGDNSTSMMMRADLLAVSLTPVRPAASLRSSTSELHERLAALEGANAALLAERSAATASAALLSASLVEKEGQLASLRALVAASAPNAVEFSALRAVANSRDAEQGHAERLQRDLQRHGKQQEQEKREKEVQMAKERWDMLHRETERERENVQMQRECMARLREMLDQRGFAVNLQAQAREQAGRQERRTEEISVA